MIEYSQRHGVDELAPKPGSGRGRALSGFGTEEVKRWILSGDPRHMELVLACGHGK